MSNHVTDEERIKRMQMVYECVVEKKMSTRECAKYMTDNGYSISNATVSDYIKRMANLDSLKYQEERKIMNNNKEKTVNNSEDVRTRVKEVAVRLIGGYTYKEVAEMLNISEFTVIRDFNVRLNLLTKEEKEILEITDEKIRQVKESQKERSIENLNNVKRK